MRIKTNEIMPDVSATSLRNAVRQTIKTAFEREKGFNTCLGLCLAVLLILCRVRVL